MHSALKDRAIESINSLIVHLESSKVLRDIVREGQVGDDKLRGLDRAAFASHDWKSLDHCLVVTRLYAIFEHFCHEVLTEHLRFIEQNVLYRDLAKPTKKKHREGVSKILQRIEGPRFAHIDLVTLIAEFQNGLSGKGYKLDPAIMLQHEHNLRLNELNNLMAECGIENLASWVEAHPLVINYMIESGREGTSALSHLDDLVSFRNKAAHFGIVIDELLSDTVLADYCGFFIALVSAIAEKVCHVDLEILLLHSKARVLGDVTEIFQKPQACVALVKGDIRCNDNLFVLSNKRCFLASVENIMIDDQDAPAISYNDFDDVGLKLSHFPSKGSKLITLL